MICGMVILLFVSVQDQKKFKRGIKLDKNASPTLVYIVRDVNHSILGIYLNHLDARIAQKYIVDGKYFNICHLMTISDEQREQFKDERAALKADMVKVGAMSEDYP